MSLENLPIPNKKRIAIHIKPAIEKHLRTGHPWLFDQAITKQTQQGQAGDIAVIYDHKNRFLGLGLYDPESPIRVKMLHVGQPITLDYHWIKQQLQKAIALREPLLSTMTDGYRVIHGENDGFPSLVIDRYSDTLVIKLYSAIWLPYLQEILSCLEELLPCTRWILRLSRGMQTTYGITDGQVLRGTPPTEPITFTENGVIFTADVIQGHKTGFFFDQRDNRAMVAELSRHKHVLDVFAYVGAFSVYAAKGGAHSVLSIDISAPALELAQKHIALNAPVTKQTHFETQIGDAFALLEKLSRQKKRFDMVIIDPPSFAKSQSEVPKALKAYSDLARQGISLLARDGVFVMASCSSRVTSDDFFNTVIKSVKQAGRQLNEIRRTAHAIDHPIRFSEGAYLKCLFATVR